MTHPKQSIRPVSSLDLPLLSDLVHTGKLALPINRLLFKDWLNDAAQKPLYAAAAEAAFKDEQLECLKAVDEGSGDILGHLSLTRKRPDSEFKEGQPTPDEEAELGKQQQDIPEFFNPDVLSAVSNAVAEIPEQLEGLDHFEPTYIKPPNRRRGIGSQLVHVRLERAKAKGIPLVVCSEPAAARLFP
ncbi:uncharacterized protein A1O5_09336 [Cladophialophora psammophila CBS 110553]|uniref:Uncharacterized protein n=1 Tax=Cladophialophora psammophila CBS 110553 TaxID=1182543 RepID=W9WHC3_9EURO|nr:uncharacterized protein A1O5_09336 [Cladophialophora psammophila CBS 110553]EXJ67323.1 hypothetical protein A1O5_09336 [Cladophialophora psammophila CBS 110553]